MNTRGRSCPLPYRYRPEALAQPSRLSADTLYVVGGLYGNLAALRAVLARAEREPGAPAAIVFNGDFHWLDIEPEDFRATAWQGPDLMNRLGLLPRYLTASVGGERVGIVHGDPDCGGTPPPGCQ